MATPIIIGGGSSEQPADKRSPEAPKGDSRLLVDESWKEKAQKEKERLAEAAEAAQEAQDERALPPASFLGLLEELAVRAMLALGQIRDPSSNEAYIDLDGAKYVIDTLGVLEEKTKNNLDATEAATLKQLLHNLRLTFVHVTKAAASAMAAQGYGAAPGAPGSGGALPPGSSVSGNPVPGSPSPGKPGPKIVY